jgi:hypothetical protein
MKTDIRVMEVDSTLEGERVGMTIDETALAHIMSILTDLYQDPEMAVIREYSTNALDAHIEAGNASPIEVTLPTSLAPFFTVKDYGAGLDRDDIHFIYSRYGTSLKRQSNDVVGMLGLGCKSALTYTDQFTLIAVKNGIEIQVSVSRDEDGGGSMTIVSETETDADSGVTIIVPAKGGNLFSSKALNFFKFWDEGTVLVNGVQPQRVDGLWIADDILLTKDTDRNYVVMGNVPYPISGQNYGSRYNNVYFVEIGDVSFTPSREALQENKKTKDKIAELTQRYHNEKTPAMSRLISEAPTKVEAMKTAMELHSAGLQAVEGSEYKGEPIPFRYDGRANSVSLISVSRTKHYGDKGWLRHDQLWVKEVITDKTLWLTGYPGADFSPHKRKQLDQWIQKQTDFNYARFILVDEIPAELKDWIDPAHISDYEPISAEKVERKAAVRADGRPTGSYPGYVDGKYRTDILADTIDTTKPLFYLESKYGDAAKRVLSFIHDEFTLILLSSNRVNKFKRDFPMAVEADSYHQKKAEEWLAGLTKDEIHEIGYFFSNVSHKVRLLELEAAKLEDPDLKWAVNHSHALDTELQDGYTIYGSMVEIDGKWTNPLEKYPLLDHLYQGYRMNSVAKDHLHIYFNGAYAATKESN